MEWRKEMLEEGWFSLTGRHIRDAYEVLTPRSRKEGLTQSFTTSVEAYSYVVVPPYIWMCSLVSEKKENWRVRYILPPIVQFGHVATVE